MSQVFAIEESAAQRVIETLQWIDLDAAYERAQKEAALFNESRSKGDKPYVASGSTAIIPLVGAMSKHYTCATWLYGGAVSSEVAHAVRAATKDDAIDKIVMLVESPGGEVSGVEDLGNAVYDARSSKKVVAVIEDMACSAGYWVASQAEEVWCNGTATVGNIGVYMTVADFSKAAAEQGVKVTVVKSAERKGDGVRGTKIEKGAFEHWQEQVDALHVSFVEAVARGRGMEFDDVAALANGRCYTGQEAVYVGLADKIGSLEDALTSLQPKGGASPYGVAAAETLGEPSMSTNQKEPGILDKIKALVNGDSASQAAPGGDGGHDETKAENDALKARIEAMEAQNAKDAENRMNAEAEAFESKLFEAGKITPTEKGEAKEAFIEAFKADGMTAGALTQRVMKAYENREPSKATQSEIPQNASVIPGDQKADVAEQAAAYLKATPLGKMVLEAKN